MLRIVRLLLTIITSLGIVMLPRMASIYAKKDHALIQSYLDKSFRYTYFIGVPLMFGLISVVERFVPIFYGPGDEPVKMILVYISPVIIFIGLSNVLGTQYQIPTNKQKDYTWSVVTGVPMFLASVAVSYLLVKNDVVVLCLQVATGGIVYIGILLLRKDKLLMMLLGKVLRRNSINGYSDKRNIGGGYKHGQ